MGETLRPSDDFDDINPASEETTDWSRTRLIPLANGRVLEVLDFFKDKAVEEVPLLSAIPPEIVSAEQEKQIELHICPDCESDKVYPRRWEKRPDDCWFLERRCPNCEWRHEGEHDHETIERFDDVLNDGTEDLIVTKRTQARTFMEEDVEALIVGIKEGHIFLEDIGDSKRGSWREKVDSISYKRSDTSDA